jgi:hypothetical protein
MRRTNARGRENDDDERAVGDRLWVLSHIAFFHLTYTRMAATADGTGCAVWNHLRHTGSEPMISDISVTIEYSLTAKFVYKGVSVQLKTGPVADYESAKIGLLELVNEAKRGIDDAAAKAEATGAGI